MAAWERSNTPSASLAATTIYLESGTCMDRPGTSGRLHCRPRCSILRFKL